MALINLFKRKENIPEQNAKDSLPSANNKCDNTPVIVDNYNHVIRRDINSDAIDIAQQQPASSAYSDYICQKFYSDYPEKPFISKDRELYTNWEEQALYFPQSLLSRDKMIRLDNGLLPGHVYMLYWLHFIHRKRIPVFFEYEFGIWFLKEKEFLKEHGFLEGDTVTQKGINAIINYKMVIYGKSDSPSVRQRIEELTKASD